MTRYSRRFSLNEEPPKIIQGDILPAPTGDPEGTVPEDIHVHHQSAQRRELKK